MTWPRPVRSLPCRYLHTISMVESSTLHSELRFMSNILYHYASGPAGSKARHEYIGLR